jgi:RNA polymerase sigma-70 factor (ECF subfamily)
MQIMVDQGTDEELMRSLCETEDRETADAAFRELFERYKARVSRWCYRFAKNREESGDLMQEIFLKAYRHRLSFRGDARFSTWLFAIARNHCLSSAGKRQVNSLQLELVPETVFRDLRAVAPDQAMEKREQANWLLGLMSRILEPMEARIMMLHYAHDVPLAAITRDLGLENPSGAKAYIVNGRRKLFGLLRRCRFQPV